MREKPVINHVLYLLAEAALLALLVGACSALAEGLLAVCGALAAACLLACMLILHVRFWRTSSRLLREEPALVPGPEASGNPLAAYVPEQEPLVIVPHDTPLAPEAEDSIALEQVPQPGTELAEPAASHGESTPGSSLDFAALSERLVASDDPIAELKCFMGDIRTREAQDDPSQAPSPLERYAARQLEEAGLLSTDVELPPLAVVRPPASRMVYLRTMERNVPYLALLRVTRIEAALNALRFACSSLDPATATQEDAYRLNQGLAHSIVAQAHPIDEPLELEGTIQPDGEWAVRYGISQAVETLQLPYRLHVRFRTNVADGNVAIEVDLTPAEAFPRSAYVDDLGIVPTTGDMRQRASADYALRLGLLLAASAFRCSERIRHVWVAGVVDNATRRTCYYAVDFDRWRFSRVDLTDLGDLAETYRSFAPLMRYEDGWLRPVRQSFHLEEERFCPKRRYLPVSLSSRRLTDASAASLGTDHVSGLAIEEADNRALVANAIMMRLSPADGSDATQKNVRTVMELAADDPDPTVRSAAERVIHGLIDGTLEDNPFAIGEEFVRGDALTRANDRAKELIMRQRPADAQRVLEPVVSHIDEAGTYADTSGIVYRYFGSYVDRALYNRLYAPLDEGRALILVPDAYYEAHLLLSVTNLMQGLREEALGHAERLVALSPLDARARLHVVRCLEELDRDDEAVAQLHTLLEEGHDPTGIGLAYYRLAFFEWKRGNIVAAQACYQCAMQFMPGALPMVAMELSMLYLQNPGALAEEVSGEQIEQTLVEHHIPVAPTERTSEVFYECAQASLDAEVFPVARNFISIWGAFAGDDIISGIARSLEDYPDR